MTPEEQVRKLAKALGRMYAIIHGILPRVTWGSQYAPSKATIERQLKETLQEVGLDPDDIRK